MVSVINLTFKEYKQLTRLNIHLMACAQTGPKPLPNLIAKLPECFYLHAEMHTF